MLILSRKIGETLLIGNDVQVTVVRIDGGKVRLGITAPEAVSVDRMEVRQIKEANRKLHDAAQDAEQDAETDAQPATDGLYHRFRVIGLPRPGVLLEYADTIEQAWEFADKLSGEAQEYIYGIGWVFRLSREREEACK